MSRKCLILVLLSDIVICPLYRGDPPLLPRQSTRILTKNYYVRSVQFAGSCTILRRLPFFCNIHPLRHVLVTARCAQQMISCRIMVVLAGGLAAACAALKRDDPPVAPSPPPAQSIQEPTRQRATPQNQEEWCADAGRLLGSRKLNREQEQQLITLMRNRGCSGSPSQN